jgi:hypothetical protein
MKSFMRMTADKQGEWFAIQLDNKLIRLCVVPEIGGRIMDLSLGDKGFFYSNQRYYGRSLASYPNKSNLMLSPNYGGSKVWLGPQGWSSEEEWPGPPDPVLDLGTYKWQTSFCPEVAWVQLQSSHDEYSGVTMERRVTVNPGCSTVHLLHRMRNTSMRPVRWSIWQVTQIEVAPGLEIVAPAKGVRQILGDDKYQSLRFNEDEKRLHVNYEDKVAKFAVKADGGWMTSFHKNRGIVLAETFRTVPGAEYPDDAPVALWINGRGTFTIHGDQLDMSKSTSSDRFAETEIMSPLTRLDPGESYEFKTRWSLAALEADTVSSVNHCGVIGERLVIDRNHSRVSGSFGVFWEGLLQLIAYNRASQVVRTMDLGQVSPLQAVQVDASIALPSEAVRCSLVLSTSGSVIGVLDHVNVC